MIVNGINISGFGATQLSVEIQNYKYKTEYYMSNKSLNPIKLKTTEALKSIKVDILFKGNNKNEVLENISKFMIMLKDKVIIKLDSYDNLFEGYLENDSIVKKKNSKKLKLKLEFRGYSVRGNVIEHMDKVTNKNINVLGTQETPAVVEITPISDTIDIAVEGLSDDPIIIKNLKANKTVIIDSELQKVTVDGVNKYSDTDMWDFPSLSPGQNNIRVSKNNCNIKIKYKPRWI
ncbi:MAG: phage tail family protein [Clostridium sp.]